MDTRRARELVAAERARIEAALQGLGSEVLKRTRRFEVAGDAPRRTIYPGNGLVALQLRFD